MVKQLILISIISSVIFFIAVAFDVSPFLRGPGVYPPDWRWDYQFDFNTIFRIWVPLALIAGLILFIKKFDNKIFLIQKHEKKLLIFLLAWLYCFIFGVLFFSRSGIFVLVDRIINPGANGQFTASLNIQNILSYLANYANIVPSLTMHAKSHPPGGIVLFWFLNQIFSLFPKDNFIANLVPKTLDVAKIWLTLLPNQKITVAFASVFIPFLLALPLVPIFYLSKLISNSKLALRNTVMYMAVPSVILFVPLLDAFYIIFPVTSLIFLIKGVERKNLRLLFASGLISGIGVFFSFTVAPFFLFYFVVLVLFLKNFANLIKYYLALILGTLTFFALLLTFNINMLSIINSIIINGLVQRHYFPWVLYNFYDFFIFLGIPLIVVFAFGFRDQLSNLLKNKLSKEILILISCLITMLTVDILGMVRGETGRIWVIFVPFFILATVSFLTDNIKLNTKLFSIIIFIQLMQVLVMQMFWVMLW
jgi:hypothetical protein